MEEVFLMRGGSRSGQACAFVRFVTPEGAIAAIQAPPVPHHDPDSDPHPHPYPHSHPHPYRKPHPNPNSSPTPDPDPTASPKREQAVHGKYIMPGCTDPLVVRYADVRVRGRGRGRGSGRGKG